MQHYLITGGAGFIGSNLANELSLNNRVTIIDDLSMGSVSNIELRDTVTFIEGDVTDASVMTDLLRKNTFDYVFHFAAIASVADSVERPVATHHVNFESVLSLLELIKAHQPQLKRLVFASSAAVYGDEPTLPKQEESVIRPLTPYAIDKFAAEKYVLAYNELYDVPTSAVRFFNVYGPNQNPKSPYSGVISIMMDKFEMARKGQASDFTLFGDGEQSRDFVYVKDVIQALLLVAESSDSRGEVYNVGTGNQTTLNNLLDFFLESRSKEVMILKEAVRQGDIPDSYADITKLQTLGYQSRYSIKEGLTEYFNYMDETTD